MPHHAVMREEATISKIRVVFYASSSKIGERSLNDTIDPGPSLLPDLVGFLLCFRELPAAVQADIHKAFFMILFAKTTGSVFDLSGLTTKATSSRGG